MAVFPVSAVSRNPNQIDVFTNAATAGAVWSAVWDGTWRGWLLIRADVFPQNTPVAVVSRHPNQLDLFAVGGDGGVYSAAWDGTWSGWFRIGDGVFAQNTPVAAVSRHPNQLDLFAVGGNGGVYSAAWNDASGWSGWFRIGDGVFAQHTPVAAVSRHPDQLDLFAVGGDGGVYSAAWNDASGWSGWFSLDLIGKNFTFDSGIARQDIDTLLERHQFAYKQILTCSSLEDEEKQKLRQTYLRAISHGTNTNPGANASSTAGGSHIDVNFGNLFPQGNAEIAQTLIHEMMHCAGYTHPDRNAPPPGMACAPPFDCPFDGGPYYGTPPLQAELCIAGNQSRESCVIDETGPTPVYRLLSPS